MAIWQDLVDDHGFAARYASVRRFVVHPARHVAARGARRHHDGARRRSPGRLRRGPDGARPATGKYRRTRLFVLTLGYSRKAVRLLVWQSSAQVWAELHERAFRRLGGTVADHRARQPQRGRAHARHLRSDAQSALPRCARALRRRGPAVSRRRSRSQGKVEAGVGHAQKTPLKGLRFETLEAAQAYLDRWEARWADTRIHGTTKRQVAAMFAEEQPALGPLPLEPFRYYRFGTARCISMAASKSRPPTTARRPAGSAAASTCSGTTSTSGCWIPRPASCCASICARRAAGTASHDDDRPARTPPKTLALLAAAKRAGPTSARVCDHIHRSRRRRRRPAHPRRARAREETRAAVVEDAATAALELGVPSYRFLRRYLERRPPVPLTLRQVDPLIRQLTLYRDLIDRTTGDPE